MTSSPKRLSRLLEIAWSLIPLIMLLGFGGELTGGIFGIVGFIVDMGIFQTALPTPWKYLITGALTTLILALFMVMLAFI